MESHLLRAYEYKEDGIDFHLLTLRGRGTAYSTHCRRLD